MDVYIYMMNMYIYICMYMYMMNMYICIYIYMFMMNMYVHAHDEYVYVYMDDVNV